MMHRALDWWSRRPLWQCAVAWLVGTVVVSGFWPLIIVTGLCIYPPVNRAVEGGDLGAELRSDLSRALRYVLRKLEPEAPEAPEARVAAPAPAVTAHPSAPGPQEPPGPARAAPVRARHAPAARPRAANPTAERTL